jgi:predicted signal transduction protein with EAL and GGDEF domain
VLLRDCSQIEAVVVLDDLRAVTPADQTFSAGLAEWDGQEDPELLVGRADRALYEAKHAGRDRIIVAAQPDHPSPVAEAARAAAPHQAPQINSKTH